jgi:hypothetical protein
MQELEKYKAPDLVQEISLLIEESKQQVVRAEDLAYRPQPFTSDANRMEFLFELYEKYTAGLFAMEKKTRKKKN